MQPCKPGLFSQMGLPLTTERRRPRLDSFRTKDIISEMLHLQP